MADKSLYETDFARWAEHTAALIRASRFSEIEAENAAEEIEDLAKQERRAAQSHLSWMLRNRIKQLVEPENDGPVWRVAIVRASQALEERLEESPSDSLQKLA